MLNVRDKKEVQWSGKAFKKMKNLKILVIIGQAIFSSIPQHLPNSLRVLEWSSYPSPSLPPDFNPKELEILNMPQSCLEFFPLLKIKKLSSSCHCCKCYNYCYHTHKFWTFHICQIPPPKAEG